MLLRHQSDASLANWRSRGKRASEQLESVRRALRYPLWGLDEALNSLRKLPDWIDHARAYPDLGQAMLERARELQDALDEVVRLSYLRGRPPTRRNIATVAARNNAYQAALGNFRATSNPKDLEATHEDADDAL